MSDSYWLWNGIIYWFLLINISHVGVDGRRYDKCSTPDGHEGICVVRRYCRGAASQHLIPCDEDNNFCCPIPTTHRSAQTQPPPRPPVPPQEPPTKRPHGEVSRNDADQNPREPVDIPVRPYQPSPRPSVPPQEPPTKRPHGEFPRIADQNPRDPVDIPVRDHTTRNKQGTDNSYGRTRHDERFDIDQNRPRTIPGKVRFDEEPPRSYEEKRTTNRDRDQTSRDPYRDPDQSSRNPDRDRDQSSRDSDRDRDQSSRDPDRDRDQSLRHPDGDRDQSSRYPDTDRDQSSRYPDRDRDQSSRYPDRDRKPVKPSSDGRDNDDRRVPFSSKDDTKRRNHTDGPSHYPSRDNIGAEKDINHNRITKPSRILPHNETYQDSKPPKFPSVYEVLSPQPKVPACGVKPYELFIAGGEESEAHEWPWMTAIFRRHQSSRPKTFLCGGSLINTKYVLTAAHCFVNNYVILPASSFVVRLGSHYLNSGEEYTVSNLVIHHNHSGSDFFNDIALVRLASEVYTTDKIAPICLPFPDMMNDNLVDRIATVAGWGDTAFRTAGSRALQHVSVPIVSSDECFAAYSRVRGAAFLARGSDHVICAGLREGGKDACLGDSGGPLMLKVHDDRWVIVGIVSLGYKCAEPGYPGVYTRITHYMSWIQDNMKPY